MGKKESGASGPTLKIEVMNGYANLLRAREVPAGYRGAALINQGRFVVPSQGGGATKHILSLVPRFK